MYPTLWSIGPLEFHSYVVLLALAVLVGVFLTIWKNEARSTPYPITTIGGLWILLGGMIGARLWWILQFDSPWRVYQALIFWEGGLVYYGGLLGGILAGVGYLRYCRVPILPGCDLIFPQVPLAHAIARMGCFLNGCCWGVPSDRPWALSFPANSQPYQAHQRAGLIDADAAHSAAVHPTQLYEVFGLLLIFGVMQALSRRPHPTGGLLFLYLVLYGGMRFFVEIFRGDSDRPLGAMTGSQMFSLALVIVGLIALAWRYYQYRHAEDRPE